MTDFRLVDKKGLKTIYGIPYSHQHIARLEKAGKFPRRAQLGACRVAWHCAAAEAWIGSPRPHPLIFLLGIAWAHFGGFHRGRVAFGCGWELAVGGKMAKKPSAEI